MRMRTLSIRTCLLLSYLVLILLLIVGMWAVADRFLNRLKNQAMSTAEQAVHQVTQAQVQVSTEVLTRMGEYVVIDKAEDAAKELAYLLARKNLKDYAALRRDPVLRKAAIQTISTTEGPRVTPTSMTTRATSSFTPTPKWKAATSWTGSRNTPRPRR